MKNGGKNKSVAFIILFSVCVCIYIYIYIYIYTHTEQNYIRNTFVYSMYGSKPFKSKYFIQVKISYSQVFMNYAS